jgi:hypothetical protein
MVYTRSAFKQKINAGIKGKIGMLIDADELMNQAVREVISDTDLRSTRRKAAISPKLFSDFYDYAAPSDLKAYGIIDIPAQVKRGDETWDLVPSEEFDRNKELGTIAVDSFDGRNVFKISADIDDDSYSISELDTLTSGGGTWEAFGDAETLAADGDDYMAGAGSIKWNISSAGGTTAGIKNDDVDEFDITDFLGGNSSIFVYHKINSATNITNYILRIGTDSSNYYSKTITAQNDGTAFVAGWNTLRFDLTSLTEIGSVTDTSINYIAIYMTKAAGKVSESDYKFDYLTLKRGEIHNVVYYSKYGWQSSAGVYKENSTDDTDLLNADTDEYDLFIAKGVELASGEVDEESIEKKKVEKYQYMKQKYESNNPSERKIHTSTYYKF